MNLLLLLVLVISVVFVSVILWIYWYLTQNVDYWAKRGVNGPKPWPIIGNLWQIYIPPSKIFTEIQWLKKYGKIYGYIGVSGPTLAVAEPELIKQILVKDFHVLGNRQDYKIPHPVVSKMLVNLDGDDWKRVRSITSPTFSSGKMKRIYPLMKQCFDDFVKHLSPLADQKANIDMKIQFSNVTLDLIYTCFFSTKLNIHKDTENNVYVKYATEAFSNNKMSELAHLAFPKILIKLLNTMGLLMNLSTDFFIQSVRQILEDRRKSGQKYNDYFQLLIDAEEDQQFMRHEIDDNEAYYLNQNVEDLEYQKRELNIKYDNKKLTENEIIGQSVMTILGGYETTATTLTFCTYELALNQDCQQKLYEEIMSAIDSKGQISYDELLRLPYLDVCLMETLRIHSPPQRTSRVTTDDYKLGNTGITLNKGQLIDIPIYAIHHSEEFYANPNEFKPERFMPENRHNIIPYTYLPFGAGPRNCIGMRFAIFEAKLGLAQIIQKYRFLPTHKTDIPFKIKYFPSINSPKSIILGIQHRH